MSRQFGFFGKQTVDAQLAVICHQGDTSETRQMVRVESGMRGAACRMASDGYDLQ